MDMLPVVAMPHHIPVPDDHQLADAVAPGVVPQVFYGGP
jgi:hypothetical protein